MAMLATWMAVVTMQNVAAARIGAVIAATCSTVRAVTAL